MCFSVQVDRDLKRLSTRFKASVSAKDQSQFKALQRLEEVVGPEKMKEILGLKRVPKSPVFKETVDGRVYPGTFTDVIVMENGERVFKKMRYRVRPRESREEVPSKFNVFNCRIDSLELRRTWQPLFMRHHGLFPFKTFFEWVEREGKPHLINFNPEGLEDMWAPCLYDTWASPDGTVSFSSFAIVTDDPPPEVSIMGHDRCPIFLDEDFIDDWLQPQRHSKQEIYDLLKATEVAKFGYQWAA